MSILQTDGAGSGTGHDTRGACPDTGRRSDIRPSDAAHRADVAVLPAERWTALAAAHTARADMLTAEHRARRSRQEKHPIEDFLYDYYSLRPARLRRWHPGAGVALAADGGDAAALAELADRAAWRWHRRRTVQAPTQQAAVIVEDPTHREHRIHDHGSRSSGSASPSEAVVLDTAAFLSDRVDGVRWIHDLLDRTAARPAQLGCMGLHEWAMVYRQEEHRHPLPLRLGQGGTDAVVRTHPIRCSHADAFRFFTPAARPLNRLQPERATQLEMEQPGCLHANMDLLKLALKLGPACPGDLLLDCFELARAIRVLDMRASPYDVTGLGHAPVAIETAPGRAQYVAAQRDFGERAAPLRERLLRVTTALLGDEDRAGPDAS